MYKTQGERAWQRGYTLARICKKIKRQYSRFDHQCVSWAVSYNMPKWIGHVPMLGLLMSSVIALTFGSFVILCTVLILWGLALASSFVKGGVSDTANISDSNDYVMESARHGQYDAPYKSPGED